MSEKLKLSDLSRNKINHYTIRIMFNNYRLMTMKVLTCEPGAHQKKCRKLLTKNILYFI